MQKQNYKFATAISMVVGCVIGSGIFFKADDILYAVNGNVMLGLLGFLIVGFGVLFGALTISFYVEQDKNNEGFIGYTKMAVGRKFSYIVGWIMISCYFPTLLVILALITSSYVSMLLGIESQLFITSATFVLLVSNLYINLKFPKLGGKIQVFATITKLIPLIVIGIIGGLFFTQTADVSGAETVLEGGRPMTALIAIAFSFDGWIVATNIANDLENSRKNLPRALAWGTLVIMIIYSTYFWGITRIVSPAEIVSVGDKHIMLAAQTLIGDIGAKLILGFIIISVYGGFNGMTLAYVRLPQELIKLNIMKVPERYQQNQFKYSVIMASTMTLFWFIFEQLVDYKLIFTNLKTSFDISAIPIIIIYIVYIVLFLRVNKLARNQQTGKRIYLLIISVLATITSLMIIGGSVAVNGLLYMSISLIIICLGLPMYQQEA